MPGRERARAFPERRAVIFFPDLTKAGWRDLHPAVVITVDFRKEGRYHWSTRADTVLAGRNGPIQRQAP